MKVLELVDLLEDTVDKAANMPLTGKALIEKEYLLDIVHEIKIKMPEEFKKAKWIEEERQKILDEARKEADEIVKSAERKAEQLVREDEISKHANVYAHDLVSNAKKKYRDIKLTTQQYVDHLLQEAEDMLEASVKIIRQNKMSIYGNKESDNTEKKAPSVVNEDV